MKNNYLAIIFLIFLLKAYSQNEMNVEWASKIGGGFFDYPGVVTVDNQNNIIVSGTYQATANLALFDIPVNINGQGGNEGFLAKYNQNGDLLWSVNYTGDLDEGVGQVFVDNLNNIYVLGSFMRTVDFDPGPSTYNMTAYPPSPYENIDVFITKLDENGNFIWAQQITGNSAKSITASLDTNGNLFFSGFFTYPITFENNLTLTPNETSTILEPRYDTFFGKIDSNGNLIWANQIGVSSSINQRPKAVSVDDIGNMYILGGFNTETDFDIGSGNHTLAPVEGSVMDTYIVKLNPQGDFMWVKHLGSTNGVIPYDLIVHDNKINLLGFYNQTLDVDPGPGVYNLVTGNTYKRFLLELDLNGDFIWAKTLNFQGSDGKLTAHPDGSLIFSGGLSFSVDFNIDGEIETFTSQAAEDMLIINYINQGDIKWVKQISCDSSLDAISTSVSPAGDVYAIGNFENAYTINNDLDNIIVNSSGSDDIYVVKISEQSLSVGEFLDDTFSIYPNPATDELVIKYSQSFDDAEINIYSMLGQKVMTTTLTPTINISSLSKGAYVLKITKEKKEFIFKLIKK